MSQSDGNMWLYQLGIRALKAGMQLVSPLNEKIRKGIKGRKSWREKLAQIRKPGENWVWIHCASLGEFEQGRNLIDDLYHRHPDWKIMVTFFSPSGYEIRKDYRHAHAVMYLPIDTSEAARDWVEALQPRLVMFIKYELWLNFISEIYRKKIPLLLVAARLTSGSSFLSGPLQKAYQTAFQRFTHIFTQDQQTLELLSPIVERDKMSVSSDTRYDRVQANKASFTPISEVERFVEGRTCLVVGSSWPVEEKMLLPIMARLIQETNVCLIIAPHEIHPETIQRWIEAYANISLAFSQISKFQPQHRILWIDNIGMLSRLYAYANVAYVGGAWKTGLHNILEPAVFGCPVIFGPKHERFPEAGELIAGGGGFSIKNEKELETQLLALLTDEAKREEIRRINHEFISQRTGATAHILNWCYEQQLLPEGRIP